MTGARTKPMRQLKVGDWIICPATGRAERVTMSRRAGAAHNDVPRWFVRTTSHDHYRPTGDLITLTERPDWAKP